MDMKRVSVPAGEQKDALIGISPSMTEGKTALDNSLPSVKEAPKLSQSEIDWAQKMVGITTAFCK